MKELTKAEEQVMQYLWELEKAFLKDIVEKFPEPRPAYTTVQTVVRVLTKKKFIGYETFGKTNQYYPLVSKGDYFRVHFKGVVNNFFNGSVSKFASFFTDDKELSITELEQMRQLIETKIKNLKDDGN
ncbi:BlaI/MecI/CopY family transcriptional regulator [Reichenbachiella ulvae]|uniref:BlaI/MecI/CopY family transcriptional regulator n=1 Tax=Reichenbachiella ulvae TaxID=2980104 RepID=A0ABT3CQP4_9BACT|nr:BlaI/MecI/CopY family transcriptional regulator [Reichenbachiella ulvae]MCV9386015.1 BlaI/MecI/CopY family transcriptional regulator [Reichenbachiella ulvae]